MNLQQLIELQDRFQPHITERFYTLIAPVDGVQFEQFVKLANDNIGGMTIHQVLSQRQAIRNLLAVSPYNNLRIYLMNGKYDGMLFHQTIEEYIAENNIDFQI